MKQSLIGFLVLLLFATGAWAQDFTRPSSGLSRVIWRDALMLNRGEAMVATRFEYLNYSNVWNPGDSSWEEVPDGQVLRSWVLNTFFGYGLTDRWEVGVHIPIQNAGFELPTTDDVTGEPVTIDENQFGLSDITLQTRYLLYPWFQKRMGWVVLGGVRLPTGDNEIDPPLGDNSIDFNIGSILSYEAQFGFFTHLKLNYWINGTADMGVFSIEDPPDPEDINIGNELEGIFIVGLWLDEEKTLMPRGSIGYVTANAHTIDQDNIEGTSYERLWAGLDFEWKATDRFTIRPAVRFYTLGKRGTRPSVLPMVNAWYRFPLVN